MWRTHRPFPKRPVMDGSDPMHHKNYWPVMTPDEMRQALLVSEKRAYPTSAHLTKARRVHGWP
jgi:hypothetical protein